MSRFRFADNLDWLGRFRRLRRWFAFGLSCAGVVWFLTAAGPGRAQGGDTSTSTADLLRTLSARADPSDNPFLSDRRARALSARLEKERDSVERLILRVELAVELLHSGQTDAAIEEIQGVLKAARARNAPPDAPVMRSLDALLGLAYLRLGEQENCAVNHSPDSCLMPIQGSGVHRRPRGSRLAAERYASLLGSDPENLGYRWLLNLAYMTLGEHPDKVPAEWLIPASAFDSDYPLPRFSEVAAQVGLDAVGLAGGSVVEDFDGDGHLDVMVSSWGFDDRLRYFHNDADGTFSEWTEKAGLTGLTGGLNLVQGDGDNDGWPDVLVLRGGWLGFMKKGLGNHPNTWLRNRGDGTFADATKRAGLLDFHPSQTAAWADYNLDGLLDLFVGNESYGEDQHPCQLFRNNGDGTFTDVAAEAGLAHLGLVKGAAWGDYDNDGRPDLYLSRFGQLNLLFRNEGPIDGVWTFKDRTREAEVGEPRLSFPTWFWDYNNDGWEDIFVASFTSYSGDTLAAVVADYLGEGKTEFSRVYRNNGDGAFSDVTRKVGMDAVLMAMGANYGDLDNDGFLDCYFGTGQPQMSTLIPNRMFRNHEGRRFQDVTTAGGFGHLQKGHGISFADLDNDGDQDVYAVLGGAFSGDVFRNALFRNPGNANHWIALELRGARANRLAVGARVKVTAVSREKKRVIHRTVGTGGSFGASSHRLHVGLGPFDRVESVEVRWPAADSRPEVFSIDGVDRLFRLIQGAGRAGTIELKTFQLGSE